MGYLLQQQPFMFPPRPQPPMFRSIPPFSSRPQAFGRSAMMPPLFQPKRSNHPPDNNNNNNSNNNSDVDDSDSESNINGAGELDDDDLHSSATHSRHPRHPRYSTVYRASRSPMLSSSYPFFRYQTSNGNLSLGPPPPLPPPPFMADTPFDDPYDIYSPNGIDDGDDDDNVWKQRLALLRYSNNGNLQQQGRSDPFTKYSQQLFYGDSQHQQQPHLYTSSQRHPPLHGSRND
jgi:hypothetical protein